MSRIKQKKQGVINSLVWTQQDNSTATISYDGTDFDVDAPVNVAAAVNFQRPVTTISTDATYAITATESGTVFVLAKADGITFTLPTAAIGLTYEFFVSTSCTSNNYGVDTDGTDNFEGVMINIDKDQAYTSTEALQAICIASGTQTHIDLNGSTTGGLVGSRFSVTAINTDRWLVEGMLHGDSNVTTCFS